MQLIIDANILFSLLIKEGKAVEVFFNLDNKVYAPEFIIEEFEKHKQEILKKTNRTNDDFNNILNIIKNIICLVPKIEFEEYIEEACKISPDPNDIMYFALALKLNYPIWSNDKKLKDQSIIKVYSTHELLNVID